jgi:hypothetical protein
VSELTWYSRFAVWVGAVVLLVQAIAGRGAGLMSLVATLLLGIGLVGFLAGLVVDARQSEAVVGVPIREESVEAESVAPPRDEPTDEPALVVPVATEGIPVEVDAAPTLSPAEETAQAVAPEPVAQVPEPAPAPASSAARAPRRTASRIPTERLDDDSPLAGETCIHCGDPLSPGDVVAVCPVCFEPQHAHCWVENHFRCSTPGCVGAGRLRAPDTGAT